MIYILFLSHLLPVLNRRSFVPPADNLEQLARNVVKFLKEHPEDLLVRGSILTMTALREAFSCQENPQAE